MHGTQRVQVRHLGRTLKNRAALADFNQSEIKRLGKVRIGQIARSLSHLRKNLLTRVRVLLTVNLSCVTHHHHYKMLSDWLVVGLVALVGDALQLLAVLAVHV